MKHATLQVTEDGTGGLNAGIAHTFDHDDHIMVACIYALMKQTLSSFIVRYTSAMSDDELARYREAERLAMREYADKRLVTDGDTITEIER